MTQELSIWRESNKFWIILSSIFLLLIISYFEALKYMVYVWETQEEYGHGYIIPFITLFLLWQKKNALEVSSFKSDWTGIALLLVGLFFLAIGDVSTIYVLQQYGLVFSIMGIFIAYMGRSAFRIVLVPIVLLFFMIPLPVFLFQGLSAKLQLISSEIGVFIIRLFDISVYLEGNVIDLGVYKLQVVEACSGLNYLFPLMTLGFISAYFFTGAFWKKTIIFLSTIPITVLMNSLRIGAIGITVENWGQEMAEGFLHDFEGWAVFMSCIVILIGEMWILASIGKDKLPLQQAFGLEFPEPTPKDAKILYRKIPLQFYVTLILLSAVAFSITAVPDRQEIIPDRKQFVEFPKELDGWTGKRGYLDQIYIDALKFTDYVMMDYVGNDGEAVNFYSAYYESQRKGASAHSPRSCIPGGGWQIASLDTHKINNVNVNLIPLTVNRLVIKKGEIKQLVYYWFQQRGRIVTNEYMMKWYLFWDALTRNRTDGALVRLTTIVDGSDSLTEADKRLTDVAHAIGPIISDYVPD